MNTFIVPNVHLLAQNISIEGMEPSEETTIIKVQKLMGVADYYHWCMSKSVELISPIHSLINQANKNKTKTLKWHEIHIKHFNLLSKSFTVTHFNSETKLSLRVDGARGEQLAFYTRKLFSTESKYNTFEREFLSR